MRRSPAVSDSPAGIWTAARVKFASQSPLQLLGALLTLAAMVWVALYVGLLRRVGVGRAIRSGVR